jgi:hypothetical protein
LILLEGDGSLEDLALLIETATDDGRRSNRRSARAALGIV